MQRSMFTRRLLPLQRAGCGFMHMSRRDKGMTGLHEAGGCPWHPGAGWEISAQMLLQHEWKRAPPSPPYNVGVRWMLEPLLVSERCFFPVSSPSCPPTDYKYPRAPPILCAKSQSPPGAERERGLSGAEGLDVFEHLCIE